MEHISDIKHMVNVTTRTVKRNYFELEKSLLITGQCMIKIIWDLYNNLFKYILTYL